MGTGREQSRPTEQSAAPDDGVLRITSPPARFFGRTPGLDGVRAIAVLTVLAFHTALFRPFQKSWLPGGDFGVDLFFVLSGFLITALLIREFADNGRVRLLAFYGRRVLRLYPPLLVLLAAVTIYVYVAGRDTVAQWSTVLSSAFYYGNWRAVWGGPANNDLGQLWSLSIEEQFYVIWPPILMALLALRLRVRLVAGLLVGALAILLIHRMMLVSGGYPWLFIYVRTDTRVDGLLLGCLAAILWSHGLIPKKGLNLAGIVALGVMIWSMRSVGLHDGNYEVMRIGFEISCALVILATVEGTWMAMWFLTLRPMRAIGRVSYGLYLWHLPIYAIVIRTDTTRNTIRQITLAIALTVAATLASWYLVEKNALKLKRHLEPRRPPDPAAGSPPETELPPAVRGSGDAGATPGTASPPTVADTR